MSVSASSIRAGRAFVELFLDDTKLVRGLRRAETRIKAFGAKLQGIGRRMVGIGLAAATPIALATRVFVGFDDQMRAVQAVIGATGEEFDMLNEKAKMLGRTTSFSAAQVAAGMLELGRAGFSPKQIDAAIASVLALSRATGTDLPEASNIAANTLRSFSLEADQMGRVADVMTATANNSAQTLMDLGEAMKYTAPVAAEYGLTLEETAKTLGALANFGIKGSMAGTTMKNILLRLADPAIRKQVESLGVSVTDAGGNLRNVSDILHDVGRAVDGMPNAKKLAIFNQIFGMRAIAGGAKLTAAEFDRLNNAIDNAAGTAAKTSKVMDGGIGGAFRRLYSAVEGIAIAVDDALAKPISDMAAWLGKAAGAITKWIKNHKQLIVTAMKVVLAVMGVGVALVALGTTISMIGTAIGGLIAVVSAAIVVIKTIAAAIAFLLSPIGLTIAAVIALGAAILHYTGLGAKAIEWLKEKFAGLADFAKRAFGGIADAMAAGNIALAGKILWLSLKVAWLEGVARLTAIWNEFKETFMAVATEAVYGTAKILTKAWAGIQTAWVETTSFMADAWARFTGTVTRTWGTTQTWLSKQITKLMGMFDDSIDVELATSILDQDHQREQQNRQRAQQQQLAQVASDRQNRLATIDQEEEGTLAELDRMKDARHVARRKQHEADFRAAKDAADAARKEWEAALAEARASKNALDTASGDEPPDGSGSLGDRIKDSLAQLESHGGISGVIEVQSTFNAMAAARGLSSGGPVDAIKDRVAEIDRNIGRLVQEAKKGGIQFA